jgi:hypothetical protein
MKELHEPIATKEVARPSRGVVVVFVGRYIPMLRYSWRNYKFDSISGHITPSIFGAVGGLEERLADDTGTTYVCPATGLDVSDFTLDCASSPLDLEAVVLLSRLGDWVGPSQHLTLDLHLTDGCVNVDVES